MKQETNHTPGPWIIEACRNHDGTRFLSINGQGPLGAWLADIQPKSVNGGRPELTAQDEANARLIAAAPNLLNILADGAEMLGKLTGDNLVTFSRTFAALANVAIAKATGKGDA